MATSLSWLQSHACTDIHLAKENRNNGGAGRRCSREERVQVDGDFPAAARVCMVQLPVGSAGAHVLLVLLLLL